MKTLKFSLKLLAFLITSSIVFYSCDKEDDPDPVVEDPIASFQYDISETNYLEVTFSNFSQNASDYVWEFGDGNTSTDESPTYTYSAEGNYTVSLTANNDTKSKTSTTNITITDPNSAIKALTGESSKIWKLYREGTCLSLGPDASNPGGWWPGLTNDGARPCLFSQTFTFHLDGTFVYDDMGMFWGENDPWNGTANHEMCFEPTADNMVNLDGADVSSWGSGTHQFTYDPSTGTVALNGMGAWMGLVHAIGTPDLYSNVPTSSRSFHIDIDEEVGYDLMTLTYDYGADGLWTCKYVSYSDASLEPAIEYDVPVFGEDLPDITPDAMSHTFASIDDFVLISPTESVSQIIFGADDPADATAAKVGEFIRTGDLYQELKFQTSPEASDINFANLTTVTVEVYLPSSNDYSGELSKAVILGFADQSATEQWWNDNREFTNDGSTLAEDTWITLTYDLSMPNAGAGTYSLYDRTDLDMFYINIGGSGHAVTGTFYVRNLSFE